MNWTTGWYLKQTGISATAKKCWKQHLPGSPTSRETGSFTVIMGPGKVVDIERDKVAYVIKFDNIETLRKISFKAKLEKG
jgi:hypothetical protein